MENSPNSDQGIRKLVEYCRSMFQHPENMEHYTEADYKEAERKFVKLCLRGEGISSQR